MPPPRHRLNESTQQTAPISTRTAIATLACVYLMAAKALRLAPATLIPENRIVSTGLSAGSIQGGVEQSGLSQEHGPLV
jgi:hypothetical protein